MSTEQTTFKTSGPLPDVHGSVGTAAEPHLHSRLVMASQVDEKSSNADNGASLSFLKIERAFTPDSKANVHLSSQSIRDRPSASADDGRLATEDEVNDLLHVVDKVPGRVWVACVAGILERFVWYGATAPLRACNNFQCLLS